MSQASTTEWLPFYLRDHMAGATAGLNLFDRVSRNHSHARVRTEVARLREEIRDDREELRSIMNDLGVRQASLTMVTAVLGEWAGRLKPNGSLLKRSVGADILELEALTAAVQAKARLWETLLALCGPNSPLDATQLRQLQERAEGQRNTLMTLHGDVVGTQGPE